VSLICMLLSHRRSRRKAKFDYDLQRWRTVCKLCGAPLERERGGQWYELEA